MVKRKKLNYVKVSVATIALVSAGVLTLTFCQPKGTKKAVSTASSISLSSKKVVVANPSSSKEKVSRKEEVKKAAEQNQASTPAASDRKAKEEVQAQVSGIDVSALAKGDFSSVTGTWSTYRGTKLVFNKDGLVALQGDEGEVSTAVTLSSGSVTDKRYEAGIGVPYKWGAAISFIPAGVPTSGDKIVYQQDCILIAQSVNDEYEPFYKISDSTDIPEERKIASTESQEEQPAETHPTETEGKTDSSEVEAESHQ
ncbi:DUF6287 domain-containing protein [Streptococcus marmotae]|uniref:DUF6287 domain-containing protein n=1 Tax=Streptococcus marmotae TaxID=1825069 RepID=UPI00082DD4AE|nr:DUF6287 domain-containing protein [Streptococcus marmotae]